MNKQANKEPLQAPPVQKVLTPGARCLLLQQDQRRGLTPKASASQDSRTCQRQRTQRLFFLNQK